MRRLPQLRWLPVCLLLLQAAPALVAQPAPVTIEDIRREFDDRFKQLRDEQAQQLKRADERYRDLERKYQDLERRLEGSPPQTAPPVPEAPPETPPPAASTREPEDEDEEDDDEDDFEVPTLSSFGDGFRFASVDEEYSLNIHLLGQTDFKVFVPGDQEPARSGLYIPRFRVYFEGNLTKPIEYELSIQRSVEGAFDVLDADVNFHYWDQFQVKFGRFLVPYSYDWYNHLEQYFIAPERALFPLNFGLSREAGLMFWGWLFDGRLEYATGGFDGQLSGLADTNTARDWVSYLNALPFRRSDDYPLLRFLNMGGSLAIGQQTFNETPLPLRTAVQSSENDEAARGASAIFLDFNDDVVASGSRAQGAIHLAWYVNHLSLESEWQIGAFQYQTGFGTAYPKVTVPVTGFHLAAGYFITGETVEDRSTVTPLRPFSPWRGQRGPGAIELFARYSQLNLGQQIFDGGLADPTLWSKSAYVTDTGFNWYLNRWVKCYFDWQHSTFGQPILLNASKQKFGANDDLFWVRLQLYY